MKKESFWGISAILLVFGLIFTGCQEAGTLSSSAAVSKVKVAGINALSLGTPSMDWMQAVEDPGHVFVGGASLQDAQVEVSASGGATVFLAQAKANVQPNFVSTNTFSFETEDFLFVEVFSENHDQYLIYAIVVHNRTPGLLDLTLDGRSAMGGKTTEGRPIASFGSLGTPANSPGAVTAAGEGTIMFNGAAAGTSLAVTLKPEVAAATARITTAAAGNAPVFSGPFMGAADGIISGLNVTAADGDYLYIEVKGDGVYSGVSYYKVKMLAKKNDRTLKSAKFVYYDGATKLGEFPLGIGTMGTNSFSGGENYGNYDNGAEVAGGSGSSQTLVENSTSMMTLYPDSGTRPPANFRLVLELEGNDPDVTFAYDYTKNQRATLEFSNTTGDFGKLIGFYWIGVEVTSAMGEKGWYKFVSRVGSEKTELGSLKINDKVVSIPPGNIAAGDASAGFATIILPPDTDMSTIKVEAAPPVGYYSKVAVSKAPDQYTDVAAVLYDFNEADNLNPVTGVNTSTFSVDSGQFIHIRVLAEISWLYGGSGFTSPTWCPAVQATQYTAWKYYKVRIVREGATPDVAVSNIKYKNNDITPPSPLIVTTTQSSSFSTDNKKNVIVTAATTTTWGNESVDYQTDDYADVVISAVPDPSTPNVRFAYALSTTNPTTAISAANFNDTGKFEGVESNHYIVIRATSEDGTNVKYYKIHLLSPSGGAYAPTDIKVNGASIGAIGDGNAAVTGTTAVNYELSAKSAFDKVTVTVDKPNPYVSVAYALASANNTNIAADGWDNTDGVFEYVNPAQYVYIRMMAADRTVTRYYKVRLMLAGAKDGAAITAIRINGTDIGPVPAANNAVTGTTAGLYRVATLQNLNNLQVSVDASEGASVAYASASANNSSIDDWANTNGQFGIFINAQWLNIRVVSEDGLTIRYYKVRIAAGSGEAALTDIKVNGSSITTESGVAIPAANTAVTGTTAVVYHVANAAALTNLTVAVSAPATASVAYAMAAAANTNTTDFTNTSGTFASFTAAQWLVIRVISEDTTTTNYYKVRVVVGDSSTVLTGITVNGTSVGSLPAANAAVTGTTAATYRSTAALSPVTVAVTGTPTGATVSYASAAAASTNTAATAFTATNSFSNFTSGQYVVIRVVSQDTINTVYYKVQVIHGNSDADLEVLRINGSAATVPAANTAGNGTNAETMTVADLANVTVKVAVSPGASVAYGTAANASTAPANFNNTTGVFTNFTANNYLVVRVISQDTQTTKYYKVQLQVTP